MLLLLPVKLKVCFFIKTSKQSIMTATRSPNLRFSRSGQMMRKFSLTLNTSIHLSKILDAVGFEIPNLNARSWKGTFRRRRMSTKINSWNLVRMLDDPENMYKESICS